MEIPIKTIVLATNNPGKIKDYQTLIKDLQLPFKFVPQSDYQVPEIAETGLTFVENAILKARNASVITGLPALGEDSGLVVDALQGAPGLYSARYAGEDATAEANIQKLLNELSKIKDAPRSARLYAVIAFMRYPNDPAPLICEGNWEGEILNKPSGNQGFGYLPIFYVPTHDCSGALLSIEERTKLNHRGQAFRQLLQKLAPG